MASATKRTCKITNKRGERCAAHAVERGLCVVHGGRVDPAAIGRKGGKVRPLTRLRERADDDLREQAREVLSQALRGENVEKPQLDAARSLFSYRAGSPPARQADGEYARERMPDGSRPVSLGDVLEFAMRANESTRATAEAWIAQAQNAAPRKVSEESRSG
jgi:plasmid stability protein